MKKEHTCRLSSTPNPRLEYPPSNNAPLISVARALQWADEATGDVENRSESSSTSSESSNDGGDIPAGIVPPSHDVHYSDPEHLRMLEEGGCLFSFSCSHDPAPHETEMIDAVINLSAFEDEARDNYVPRFDMSDYEEGTFSFLLARCAYLLHGVDDLDDIADVSLLSSAKYQRACQPGGTKVWTDYDNMESDNFRITKPIIPYIYSFTIQFRVSALAGPDLAALGRHVGVRVDRGILLERTKRSVPPKEDATKKCKSVLLYTALGGGIVLVTHLTVLLQRGLPNVVERVVHTFGSWGLGETCETAWKTRGYLRGEVLRQKKMINKWDDASFRTAVSQAYLDALSSFGADSSGLPDFSLQEAREEVSSTSSEAYLDAFSSLGVSSTTPCNVTAEEAADVDSSEQDRNGDNACTAGSDIYSDAEFSDNRKEDDGCHSCQCFLGWNAAHCCRTSNMQRAPLIAADHVDFFQT